ncbi:MAG: hypothetical protein PSN44_08560 [Gammaproteobacteria bacterium]|nr:hypothetical protein [Gammaproteobacteria bacterium]
MPITSQNAVNQAIANINLESLSLSTDILKLINESLEGGSIDTTYILNLLRG